LKNHCLGSVQRGDEMTDAFGKKLEVGDITVSCMSGPDGVFVDIGKVVEIQDEDISIEQLIGQSFHRIIMKVGSGNADLKTILNHVLRDLPGGMPEIRYTDDGKKKKK
jgi:hypothetical protein